MDVTITHIATGDVFYAIADADQPQLRTVENHLRVLPIPVCIEQSSLLLFEG